MPITRISRKYGRTAGPNSNFYHQLLSLKTNKELSTEINPKTVEKSLWKRIKAFLKGKLPHNPTLGR